MSINRYKRAPKLRNGRFYGTFDACYIVAAAVAAVIVAVTAPVVRSAIASTSDVAGVPVIVIAAVLLVNVKLSTFATNVAN